jgi:hypothetical protein
MGMVTRGFSGRTRAKFPWQPDRLGGYILYTWATDITDATQQAHAALQHPGTPVRPAGVPRRDT